MSKRKTNSSFSDSKLKFDVELVIDTDQCASVSLLLLEAQRWIARKMLHNRDHFEEKR